MQGFVIAAPQSGSGKTTVSLGLMAALTRRGRRVAPFKAGPDFIDPGYHRLVTGRVSVNLDAWICPPEFVRATFNHHAAAADIAVVEGVMGLFDGLGGSANEGSTAQIARLIGAPVVLVVNARGMAASAAALVAGFAGFDPAVRVAGVIFNNVGSARHAELLQQAVQAYCPGLLCLGSLPRDEQLAIPSRHLGLVTADENPLPPGFVDRLAEQVERHIDLDLLERLAQLSGHAVVAAGDELLPPARAVLAVARDAAFCFLYEDNLRLLEEAGGALRFFSPLTDHALPEGCQGIYLPGGYPELYQAALSANRPMLEAIRAAVRQGLPLYAECGGLVYLTEGLLESDAARPQHPLLGMLPTTARLGTRRAALGYREVELACDTFLGAAGSRLRGHEFHYSSIAPLPEHIGLAYRVARPGEAAVAEGFSSGSCLASYVHLHFGSHPAAARALIDACAAVPHMLEPPH